MSAFVVSKTHIDHMVKAALHYGGHSGPVNNYVPDGLSWWRVDESGGYAGWREVDECRTDGDDHKTYCAPSDLGQMLVDENVASVSYRYHGEQIGELPGPIDCDYQREYVYADPGHLLTPAEVFKAIDCLDYQSCEHPGWRTSEASAFCSALRDAACRKVDGYEQAPWDFDRTFANA